MRKVGLLLFLLSLAASAQEVVNGNRVYVPGTGTATQVPNASTTGTTINTLAKLTGAGTAVITATTDTSGAIGVVVGGAGTSGNASIVRDGQALLVFDGATTADDYVQMSSTVLGNGHDAGATCPSSGQVVGRVLSTNGGAGTYTIIVGSSGCGGGGGSGTINAAAQFSDPYYSASGSASTISGIAAPTGPNGVPQTKVSIPSSGAATTPQFALPGVAGRAVTGATSTDTILPTDCNPFRVTYIGSVSVAVTLPTATTLGVPNCAFKVVNGTSGSSTTVTITPTTWTISAGGGTTGASLVLQQGQEASVFVDPNSASNWVVDRTEQGLSAGSGITFTRSSSGLSLASTAGGGSIPCSVHYAPIAGASDQITAAGAFATTQSVATTCIGVGTLIIIRAHGVFSTTATAGPHGTFEVNAGGTTGICPAAAGTTIATGQTNGYWELTCYIQINTTGAPGTAVPWGTQFLVNSSGSGSPVTWGFNTASTGTASYTTSSAQTVSVQETGALVTGQTFNLTALDILVVQ